MSVARKVILFELFGLSRRRDLHMPQRKGCGMTESIGLKNVGEKLESKVSKSVDIYLLDVIMILPHGQVMTMEPILDHCQNFQS